MNYLGHAVLSFGQEEILVGNMIADHVKGRKSLETFPERIRQGIVLHRQIDAFTDAHPAIARAKIWFRADFGLYSGAVIDSLLDHFLANDPHYFPTAAALQEFSARSYEQLARHAASFPEIFAGYFPHMRDHDWLFNYRNHKGVQRSLKGLQRRAKYIPDTDKAYALFLGHYYQLAQCYEEFIAAIDPYVKRALAKQAS